MLKWDKVSYFLEPVSRSRIPILYHLSLCQGLLYLKCCEVGGGGGSGLLLVARKVGVSGRTYTSSNKFSRPEPPLASPHVRTRSENRWIWIIRLLTFARKDGKCEPASSPLRVCLLRFICTIYEESNEENLELSNNCQLSWTPFLFHLQA